MPAPHVGRRFVVGGLAAFLGSAPLPGIAQEPHFRIAFANLNEEPGARLEGLGFTGLDVRRSFQLAARTLPVDMLYYDNAGDDAKALANVAAAIAEKADLVIEYHTGTAANAEIARRLKAAGIPALAINYPVPGAPLYGADNLGAGRIAGLALGQFARQNWPDETVIAAIVGNLDEAAPAADRARGIAEGLRQELPDVSLTRLDSGGNPLRIEGVLSKFLASQSKRKVLVGALDDASALAAKTAIELARRLGDCIIVGQGVDRSIHGGAGDRKELDPSNRGSIVLGSVAYYMDRYGYDVLPLALKMLRGESVPPRTVTQHTLITAKNVFAVYPPYDMN
ncbi:MAG: ribose transport system substrate-binding protein [Methylobacteriaceae bacterium]|jgi:ribose transport system substrate-binding protein|nr:ribose transport system substrate-binding protein [Methylobacteriaceae bacterium]